MIGLTLTMTLGMMNFQPVRAHEFVFTSPIPLVSVDVAGTFNGWTIGMNPLESTDGQNWSGTIQLPLGRHEYKFVLNSTEWVLDPLNDQISDDGNGNLNSVLEALPEEYNTPAATGNGFITRSALSHAPELPWLNYDRGALSFRFHARPDDIERIALLINDQTIELVEIDRNSITATYEATLAWSRDEVLRYRFQLEDGDLNLEFGPQGLAAETEAFVIDPATFKPFVVPAWVERSVFYQIFPDRFANGNLATDPADVVAWDARPTYTNRKGGDVAGIQQNLGYLEGLGINAIYFCPVFKSPANHRYETTDYLQIDPVFGTNEEFSALTRALRDRGIRTVLDGVFNHSGSEFGPFVDVRERGPESNYLDWFFIADFPVEVRANPSYAAWYGFPNMPKLNTATPAVRDYLFNVVRTWNTTAAVDGWRLDAANEVPHDFWQAFRPMVKAQSEDQWILGEVWGDGRPWLKGDQWDSVMNYPFRDAVLRYIAQGSIDAEGFLERLMRNYRQYPPQVSRNLLNLIGSHDTARFKSEAGGDSLLAKLGATALLTWVGAPMIYYGDETGMQGGRDPLNRYGKEWHRVNEDNAVLNHYRTLIALRRSSEALQVGDPLVLGHSNEQDWVAFGRTYEDEHAVVIINRGAQSQEVRVELPKGWDLGQHQDIFQRSFRVDGDQLVITLPGRTSAVIAQATDVAAARQFLNENQALIKGNHS